MADLLFHEGYVSTSPVCLLCVARRGRIIDLHTFQGSTEGRSYLTISNLESVVKQKVGKE